MSGYIAVSFGHDSGEGFCYEVHRISKKYPDLFCDASSPLNCLNRRSLGKEFGGGGLVSTLRKHEITNLALLVDRSVEIDPIDMTSPFGGIKRSGIGKDLGRAGYDKYQKSKSVWVELGLPS